MSWVADRHGQTVVLKSLLSFFGLTLLLIGLHPTPSHAQSMTLPGSFSVNGTGAATYTIPISVPPGTAGMVPSLTLSYSSQNPNGLLGMGWSLDGLPSIGRCTQTMAQDGAIVGVNYSATDRFCFEGQRLVAISGSYGADGTEYRTEIDSYSRIFSHGTSGTGPTWFEVHTKAGLTMEFGHTPDSQILAQGKPTARSWAVNKVSDSKTNYFTVSYVNDATNGQAYPSRIDYTGNAAANLPSYNSVQFVYATRPDITATYLGGSLSQTTVRLTDVKTYIGAMLVADYGLTYGQSGSTNRSHVTSLQVCDASANCLPATTVSSSDGGGGITRTNNAVGIANTAGWKDAYSFYPGDYNGDGIADLILIGSSGSFFCPGPGITLANNCGSIANGSGWKDTYGAYPGDYNGDGITDLLLVGSGGSFFCAGPGVTSANNCILIANSSGWLNAYGVYPADYNGDGITDLFLIGSGGSYFCAGPGITSVNNCGLIANGSGWKATYAAYPGDYNGDGATDLLLIGSAASFFCPGPGITSTNNCVLIANGGGWKDNYVAYPGDYNGDGATDLLLIGSGGSFFCPGPGLTSTNNCSLIANGSGWKDTYAAYPGDYNGDGIADLILVGSVGSFYCAGPGITSTNNCALITSGDWKDAYSFYAGDFNGDGTVDLIMVGSASSYFAAGGNGQPDHVNLITTGVGATTSIVYAPITSSAIYTKDKNAVYPQVDVQSPIYVVSRVDSSNGIGGSYSSTYSYAGAKLDSSGRGFLGFRQTQIIDWQTGIIQTATYGQAFPYIGLMSAATRYLNLPSLKWLTLNQATTTYQFSNSTGVSTVSSPSIAGAPYHVSVASSVSSSFDLDGSAIPPVATTYQYDAYGNATQVLVSTSDGFSKTTANTYTNDTTHWWLGRLTATTVTSVAP